MCDVVWYSLRRGIRFEYLRGSARGRPDLLFIILFLLLFVALGGSGSLGILLLWVGGRVCVGLSPCRFSPLLPLPVAPGNACRSAALTSVRDAPVSKGSAIYDSMEISDTSALALSFTGASLASIQMLSYIPWQLEWTTT